MTHCSLCFEIPRYDVARAQFGCLCDSLPSGLGGFGQTGKEFLIAWRAGEVAFPNAANFDDRSPCLRRGLLKGVGDKADTIILITADRAIDPCLVLITSSRHRFEFSGHFPEEPPICGRRFGGRAFPLGRGEQECGKTTPSKDGPKAPAHSGNSWF